MCGAREVAVPPAPLPHRAHPPGPCLGAPKDPAEALGPRHLKCMSIPCNHIVPKYMVVWYTEERSRYDAKSVHFPQAPPPLGDPGAAPPALGRGVIRYKYRKLRSTHPKYAYGSAGLSHYKEQ